MQVNLQSCAYVRVRDVTARGVTCEVDMQKKRTGKACTDCVRVCCYCCSLTFMQSVHAASLPIFNRGKRPRQALLTHPNNVDGASLEQQQRQDGCWNSKSYGHAQAQHRDGPPRSAIYRKRAMCDSRKIMVWPCCCCFKIDMPTVHKSQ